MQIAGPFLLIGLGEEHVTSSLAGILVSAVPIFTALLALRFDAAERARGWALVGIVIGIGGVALLFGVDLTGGTAAVLGGVGHPRREPRLRDRAGWSPSTACTGVAPLAIVSTRCSPRAVLMVPLLPFSAPDHAPALDTIGAMLALGVGGTGLAFLLFYTLVHEVGPARTTLVAYIAPGFSVAYGALLLDEPITAATIAGLVLILFGSYLGAEGRLPWSRPAGRAGRRAVRRRGGAGGATAAG